MIDVKEWLANMRRKYHRIVHGGTLTTRDMAEIVKNAEVIQLHIEKLREEIIDFWHGVDSTKELHEHLHMTWEEYKVYANPSALKKPKQLHSTELDWLKWFAQEADFGPADGDVSDQLKRQFAKETGTLPAKGWHYWSSGEPMTDEDLERIKNA